MVIPAAGTTLCWLLLTTLWLPAFDYARSLAPQMHALRRIIGPAAPCVQVRGLGPEQVTALRFYGGWPLMPAHASSSCPWLVVNAENPSNLAAGAPHQWRPVGRIAHRPNHTDTLLVVQRVNAP
jgi:hypothetical protein